MTKQDNKRPNEQESYTVSFDKEDIIALDGVTDLSLLYPQKPSTTVIIMCCKGECRLSANGQDLEIREGDILLCPPNLKVVGYEPSEGFVCKVLCVSDHLIRPLLLNKADLWHQAIYVNQLNVISTPSACGEDFEFYLALIQSKLKRNGAAPPSDILLSILRAFLLELCFIMQSSKGIGIEHKMSQGKILFNRFLSLISNNAVKRQPIAVYADSLAITPKYLTMLCLKYSNKTASEWVAQYTVEDIRFYLKSTSLSIKEISARLGFSNMSHFGSYVRKHLGISPSEYRFSSSRA